MYEAFDADSDPENYIDCVTAPPETYHICYDTCHINSSYLCRRCDLPVPVRCSLGQDYTLLSLSSPISAYWTISLTPQKCITGKWFLLCMGVLNIIADFLVVLIPIPVVLGLRLPLKQRIIVSFLFGAGFIVCIAGIFRTYYFYKLTSRYHDITWDAIPVWIATVVELYLGIVRTQTPFKIYFDINSPGLYFHTAHQTILCTLYPQAYLCNDWIYSKQPTQLAEVAQLAERSQYLGFKVNS